MTLTCCGYVRAGRRRSSIHSTLGTTPLLSTWRSWRMSAPQGGDQQAPRPGLAKWLKVNLTEGSSGDHMTLLICSDNLYISGFSIKQGCLFAFCGDEAKIPSSTRLNYGGGYNDLSRMEVGFRGMDTLPISKKQALSHSPTSAATRTNTSSAHYHPSSSPSSRPSDLSRSAPRCSSVGSARRRTSSVLISRACNRRHAHHQAARELGHHLLRRARLGSERADRLGP